MKEIAAVATIGLEDGLEGAELVLTLVGAVEVAQDVKAT